MPSVTRPDTPFIDAVDELIASIECSIPTSYTGKLNAFLVGGVAVHVHTGWRVSKDIRIHIQKKVIIPPDSRRSMLTKGRSDRPRMTITTTASSRCCIRIAGTTHGTGGKLVELT